MIHLIYSLWHGERATDNPWDARGLEWTTTSPQPHNFETLPIVGFEPYDYPNRPPEIGQIRRQRRRGVS